MLYSADEAFQALARTLRAEGFNHVDGNRWAKVRPRSKILYARIVPATEPGGYRIAYA